jgi:hypothetical protein
VPVEVELVALERAWCPLTGDDSSPEGLDPLAGELSDGHGSVGGDFTRSQLVEDAVSFGLGVRPRLGLERLHASAAGQRIGEADQEAAATARSALGVCGRAPIRPGATWHECSVRV